MEKTRMSCQKGCNDVKFESRYLHICSYLLELSKHLWFSSSVARPVVE